MTLLGKMMAFVDGVSGGNLHPEDSDGGISGTTHAGQRCLSMHLRSHHHPS